MNKRSFLKKLLYVVPAAVLGSKLETHQELVNKLMKESKPKIPDNNFNPSGITSYYNVSGVCDFEGFKKLK